MIAIFGAALFPLVMLFVPETAYQRDAGLNTDTELMAHRGSHGSDHELKTTSGSSSLKNAHRTSSTGRGTALASAAPAQQQPLISREALMPFNGRKTSDSFLKLLLRPFPLFFHPGIFMMMLIQGTLIGWTVLIGIVLAAIMLGPPLFFNEVQTGYMYTGAFIGALLGFLLAGLLSDSSVKWMTKRNRGIYGMFPIHSNLTV
jgi:hypothetical protein